MSHDKITTHAGRKTGPAGIRRTLLAPDAISRGLRTHPAAWNANPAADPSSRLGAPLAGYAASLLLGSAAGFAFHAAGWVRSPLFLAIALWVFTHFNGRPPAP